MQIVHFRELLTHTPAGMVCDLKNSRFGAATFILVEGQAQS